MSDPRMARREVVIPTLYLTNWSSPRLHGPGRKLTIMARPRAWEHGEGVVVALQPRDETRHLMVSALADRSNVEAMATYLRAMEVRWRAATDLGPGRLECVTATGLGLVHDGDTLCCACARGAECHRRWAAPFLVAAGWRVILDGVEFLPDRKHLEDG